MATGVKSFTGSNGKLGWIAALVVKDDGRTPRREPAGGAFDPYAAPIEPPAPGLLSTITGTRHASLSFLPSSRAKMSFDPPAGYGTTIVTGFAGYGCCAQTG